MRRLLCSSLVFLPRLASCLAGLLLVHGQVFAQEAASLQAVEPRPVHAQIAVAGTSGFQKEASMLLDTSGDLTVDQVHARFEAGEGQPVSAGQIMPAGGGRTLWYQLKLSSVAIPARLVLAVPYPGMDNVELYRLAPQAGGEGEWQLQRSGDQIPVMAWPLRHLYPAFELQVLPGENRPTYLRIAHNHPILVYWTLSDARSFQERSEHWHLLLGIYIGLVLLIVVMSAFHAVSWRDSIHLFYAGYVLVVAVGQLALTGLGGEYFWPGSAWWNDRAPVALTLLGAAFLHLLLRQLVVERDVPSWLSRWLLTMSALGAMLALGFVVAENKPYFVFPLPYYLVSMAVYLGVAGWYARRRPRVGLWVLAAMICLAGGSIFPLLLRLGLLPLSVAAQYGAQIGAALEILLLLIGLYFRSNERRDTHARVGALGRVDPLTGVASHRVLLRRLEQLILRQERHPGAGAVLRIRVGNAIDIRQEYGMEAAQGAVVHAGACVTAVAQEGDTVARHRDGDFVLILQGNVTREQLTALGQRLIARGLTESPSLPPRTVLRLKVAVAQAPFKTKDPAQLLQSLGAVLAELAGHAGTALRFVSAPDAPHAAMKHKP
ncbi:sensor domain-containing diguanylate cyclase [Polaromonas sp. JS666]|uniref:sensor domain-containing diguanylate cyclase n=1 Tax=Polaromonas sp. (strain JS666 / ATCC BAA-500) TaxID=296591 RepID=UPI001E333973|nr:7TM diverse intracellular signaling domain-containing protein [Polaromonas sp. JS666]